ncbi:hypothetical protein GW17_00027415 [Ensete ventricosum]|nr:hypothetical protein GW17_00027415 [Ensete ventricosum]
MIHAKKSHKEPTNHRPRNFNNQRTKSNDTNTKRSLRRSRRRRKEEEGEAADGFARSWTRRWQEIGERTVSLVLGENALGTAISNAPRLFGYFAYSVFAVRGVFGACLVDTLRLRGSWSKHCWFRPVCASSPAIFLVRSWSSAGWVMVQNSAWEVGYWSGGAPVGKKYPSSGRSLIPARRSGRVGSRRDPSDGRVNLVVPFSIPLPRRGAGAFIVSVVDHSYLVTLLFLWPTMPSYPSTTLVVPVVRRAFAECKQTHGVPLKQAFVLYLLTLVASVSVPSPMEDASDDRAGHRRRLRTMVVDDNPTCLKIITTMLAALHFVGTHSMCADDDHSILCESLRHGACFHFTKPMTPAVIEVMRRKAMRDLSQPGFAEGKGVSVGKRKLGLTFYGVVGPRRSIQMADELCYIEISSGDESGKGRTTTGGAQGSCSKKQRMGRLLWDSDLHRRFLTSVELLGKRKLSCR